MVAEMRSVSRISSFLFTATIAAAGVSSRSSRRSGFARLLQLAEYGRCSGKR